MTETQQLVLGGAIVGGMLSVIVTLAIILYVLLIIAWWKIFTKAGEAGWKSLIPIYNVYVLCRIIGISFWKWIIGLPILVAIVGVVVQSAANIKDIANTLSLIYSLVIGIVVSVKLAKVFNKGIIFTLGLILLPNIFELILGFGSAKYVESNK